MSEATGTSKIEAYVQGRRDERAAIMAWLRKTTAHDAYVAESIAEALDRGDDKRKPDQVAPSELPSEPPTSAPKRQGAVMAGAATIAPTIAPPPKGFTPTATLHPTGRGTTRMRCVACGNSSDVPSFSPQVECPNCGVTNHRTLP